MVTDNFEKALEFTLKQEGGYVNNPNDPGGETNFGITKAVAVANGYTGDMKAIPMDVVSAIYKKDYWMAARCPGLQYNLDLAHFDAAVNHGVVQAGKFLQQSINALSSTHTIPLTVDGLVGIKTGAQYGALQSIDQGNLPQIYNAIRIMFYINLNKPMFIHGWLNRVISLNAKVLLK